MEACLECSYLNNNKCKKTGWNLKGWKEKQYLKTKMKSFDGRYFEEKIQFALASYK